MSDRAAEYLRLAFQAILRGDYAERDRLCELANREIDAQQGAEDRLRQIHSTDLVTLQ